jgi:hypothetical protein
MLWFNVGEGRRATDQKEGSQDGQMEEEGGQHVDGSCFGDWKERIVQLIANECSIKRDRFALIVVEVEL